MARSKVGERVKNLQKFRYEILERPLIVLIKYQIKILISEISLDSCGISKIQCKHYVTFYEAVQVNKNSLTKTKMFRTFNLW